MAARELLLCPPSSSASQSPEAQGPSTGMLGQGWTLALQRAFCFVSSCAGPGLMRDSALTREPHIVLICASFALAVPPGLSHRTPSPLPSLWFFLFLPPPPFLGLPTELSYLGNLLSSFRSG